MLLAGRALVWRGAEELELTEGDAVFLPRNVPHAYRIQSATADLLMICTPAGIEQFFRNADPGPEAAARFGITITGPPPEPRG